MTPKSLAPIALKAAKDNILVALAVASTISSPMAGVAIAQDWLNRRCSIMESGLVRRSSDCLFKDGAPNFYEIIFEGRRYQFDSNSGKLFIDGVFHPQGDGNYSSSIASGCSFFLALARTTQNGPARVQPEDYPLGLCVSQ